MKMKNAKVFKGKKIIIQTGKEGGGLHIIARTKRRKFSRFEYQQGDEVHTFSFRRHDIRSVVRNGGAEFIKEWQ